jgi:galactonate dehydratase
VDRSFANEAVAKIKALRDAVGPDVEIMLDLAGGLTPDETIRLCDRLEPLDILFVEEPADPFDLGALEKIAARISIPIAVGERLYTRYGFRPLLESRAADILQPDIGNCGGILEVKKIAAMAEAYSLRVQPHVCASPLSMMVALHLDACIPNFLIQEAFPYWSEEAGYVEILEDPPELWIRNGRLPIPDRPGLGVTLVRDRIDPFLWGECGA